MAVAHLEPHMEKVEGQTKGTIVLATVKGDVHDIGKNLVDIILSNNGYTVHNIGIKQPISTTSSRSGSETKADAIGLSGLLVKSSTSWKTTQGTQRAGCDRAGACSGAPRSGATLRRGSTSALAVRGRRCYYGKRRVRGPAHSWTTSRPATGIDVINGEIDDRVSTKRRRTREDQGRGPPCPASTRAAKWQGAAPPPSSTGPAPRSPMRRAFRRLHRHTTSRSRRSGARVSSRGIDLDDDLPVHQHRSALFRGAVAVQEGQAQPTPRNTSSAAGRRRSSRSSNASRPTCRDRERSCSREVVYGYFPVQSDGRRPDRLRRRPTTTARSNASPSPARTASASASASPTSSASVDSGQKDVLRPHLRHELAKSVSRAKPRRSSRQRSTTPSTSTSTASASRRAEALAEMWHKRIRHGTRNRGRRCARRSRRLFTQKYRGSRYSFGYPACPEMSDQDKPLAPASSPARIGCAPHRQLADRPRAVHQRHHRPPPRGEVLQRLKTGIREQAPGISGERWHRLPACG